MWSAFLECIIVAADYFLTSSIDVASPLTSSVHELLHRRKDLCMAPDFACRGQLAMHRILRMTESERPPRHPWLE